MRAVNDIRTNVGERIANKYVWQHWEEDAPSSQCERPKPARKGFQPLAIRARSFSLNFYISQLVSQSILHFFEMPCTFLEAGELGLPQKRAKLLCVDLTSILV
jgi:hypothetical protein